MEFSLDLTVVEAELLILLLQQHIVNNDCVAGMSPRDMVEIRNKLIEAMNSVGARP